MLPQQRAHYDRLMTWATTALMRQGPEVLEGFQEMLTIRAAEVAKSQTASDEEKIIAVLAELGFASMMDNVLETIKLHEDTKGGAS